MATFVVSPFMSIAAMIYSWLCRQRPTTTVQPRPDAAARYRDGCIVATLTALPQALLLAIPFIYPHGPSSVPRPLAEGAIMAAATWGVLWVWAITCFARAGTELPLTPTARQKLGMLLPLLISLIVLIGFGLGFVR